MTPEQQTPASVVEALREVVKLSEYLRSATAQCDRDARVYEYARRERLTTAAAQDAIKVIERLSAEREVLREALVNIQIEAERENGRWNHLKRVIAINARAALTQGESRQTEETGWLIETDDNGLRYRTATRWTADASDGLRFARREDAEAFLAAFETDHFRTVATPARRVAEHRWG